jgi:hypothetical protein
MCPPSHANFVRVNQWITQGRKRRSVLLNEWLGEDVIVARTKASWQSSTWTKHQRSSKWLKQVRIVFVVYWWNSHRYCVVLTNPLLTSVTICGMCRFFCFVFSSHSPASVPTNQRCFCFPSPIPCCLKWNDIPLRCPTFTLSELIETCLWKSYPAEMGSKSIFNAKSERSWLWGCTISVVHHTPVISFSRPGEYISFIRCSSQFNLSPKSYLRGGNRRADPGIRDIFCCLLPWERLNGSVICTELWMSAPVIDGPDSESYPTETWIALVQKGQCKFVKVREAQRMGGRATVVGGEDPAIHWNPKYNALRW